VAPASAGAAADGLTAEQLEYLRVLQENQLLRQYLSQCQVLINASVAGAAHPSVEAQAAAGR
jgi:hypothetical protein